MINVQEIIRPNLSRFAAIVRKEIGGRATSKYMVRTSAKTPEEQRAIGKNTRTGIGTLRSLSGRLSRSLTGQGTDDEGGVNVVLKNGRIDITYFSKVPYANTHEQGFSGTVSVSAHQRTITQAFGKPIKKKQVSVRAHSKRLTIPARPYLQPAAEDSRGILQRRFSEIIADEIVRNYGK